jgi:fibronectin-binding autotransporter adhesin
MLRRIFVVLFFFLCAELVLRPDHLQAAPLAKDCLSAGSGVWSEPATWTGCDGGTPQAADNVYLQAGHTIQLAGSTAVNDLNLNIGIDSGTAGSGAKLQLGSSVLELHGKLRSYYGGVGTVPGVSGVKVKPDAITITPGSGGRIRVVGQSRTLTSTGEWGPDAGTASTATMVLEIAADADAVIRMEVPIWASNWFINSGTFDALQKLLVDQGVADAGNITVGPEGTLISEVSSAVPVAGRLSTLRGGTFTVNGRLILTGSGQRIYMLTTAFNNIVEYNSANSQGMAAKYTGTGLYQYNHLVLSGGGAKILADNTTVTGSLTRSGTATLSLGSPTAKTLTYGPDAELVYGGTARQTTGPELSAAAAGGIAALRVENPAGVKLGQNLLVKNSITLGGDLDTGTYSLTLGAQAACAGAGDVLGTVLRLEPPASGSYCLGNPNLQITLPPGATLPSSLSVVMSKGTAPFSGAVLRRYTIEAPEFGGTAGLRLPYNAEDLNGNDAGRLHLWHDVNGTWTLVGATGRGVDELGKHYVEGSGITGFSDWALADGGAPAAVTVLEFQGEWAGSQVRLHWQTASEIDCTGFVVWRSRAPGTRGERVAEVPARTPGSPAGASYTWEDPQGLGPPGDYYYWLDVVDQRAGIVPEAVPAVVRVPGVYLAFIGR